MILFYNVEMENSVHYFHYLQVGDMCLSKQGNDTYPSNLKK